MKEKIPKLESFVIIGRFKDGKTRQFILNENTERAILNMIVMIEGTIRVMKSPIEGIELSKRKTHEKH